jgi:hypothetical protein
MDTNIEKAITRINEIIAAAINGKFQLSVMYMEATNPSGRLGTALTTTAR